MADSISSFFTSLFPSSKPPPKPTHNLRSDARTVGSTTPPTTSTAASSARAGANNGNNNNGRGPTTPAAAADASQQIRDQRAQFLDKLSSGPARGKWKGNNSNAKGSKPSVQSQPSA